MYRKVRNFILKENPKLKNEVNKLSAVKMTSIHPEIDYMLGEINNYMRNPNLFRSSLPSHWRKIADEIKSQPSDYGEIKISGIRRPQDYIGAVYPSAQAPEWDDFPKEMRDKVINGLKSVYGDKALPYRGIYSDNDKRLKALHQLARSAGIIK